jgi:hypothetical protein
MPSEQEAAPHCDLRLNKKWEWPKPLNRAGGVFSEAPAFSLESANSHFRVWNRTLTLWHPSTALCLLGGSFGLNSSQVGEDGTMESAWDSFIKETNVREYRELLAQVEEPTARHRISELLFEEQLRIVEQVFQEGLKKIQPETSVRTELPEA